MFKLAVFFIIIQLLLVLINLREYEPLHLCNKNINNHVQMGNIAVYKQLPCYTTTQISGQWFIPQWCILSLLMN
jgi:hypothetical protein